MAIICFVTYILISDNNILTPDVAFVSLTLFNILNSPIYMLGMCVMAFAQVKLVFMIDII